MKSRHLQPIGILICCLVLLYACSPANEQAEAPSPAAARPANFTPIPSPTLRQGGLPTAVAATASPIQASTDTPEPSVLPGAAILVEDDFIDSQHYWIGVYGSSKVTVDDGKLVLNSNPGSHAAGAYCEDCGPFPDTYFYEADVAIQKDSSEGYGLIFGYQSPEKFYNLGISPKNGVYVLFKLVNNEWLTLIDWTNTADLNPYPEQNKIGVFFDRGEISVYINGKLQDDTIDPKPYDPGTVGFYSRYGYILLTATHMVVYPENPYR